MSKASLSLTKPWVKQGRQFASRLSRGKKHAGETIYWRISGNGISESDLKNGLISGSETLKKDGSLKQKFFVANNEELKGNTTIKITYFEDPNKKIKLAEESIKLIKKSQNINNDQGENWKLSSTRIDTIKENVAFRAQISNGTPGDVIFYKLSGKGLTEDDLDLSYGRMSGKARIDSKGEAVIPFRILADNKTEGQESMTFGFYKDPNYKKKYSSFTLNILDESTSANKIKTAQLSPKTGEQPIWSGSTKQGTWFTISPSRSEIQENQSSRTKINSNSQSGQILYFKISGKGIDNDDFDPSYAGTSGKVVINKSGSALIPHLLKNDNKTEGKEFMTISLYRDKQHKNLVATSTVPIRDTSTAQSGQPPTRSQNSPRKQPAWGGAQDNGSWFTLSPGRASYSRGERIGIRIDSDALPGANVIWKLRGENIRASDFEPAGDRQGLSGEETIGLNGIATFELTTKSNYSSNNDSEITFDLYRKSNSKQKLASTSLTIEATPTEILANKEELQEGGRLGVKIFAKGIPEGEKVFWDASGDSITDNDFSSARSGTRTLDSSRKFKVFLQTQKDLLTEGSEFFQINLYSNESKSNLISSTSPVKILDSSTTQTPSYELKSSSASVLAGKGFKIKIKAKNITGSDSIYWKSSDLASANGLVYLEAGNKKEGKASLDSNGKAILQFRTLKQAEVSDATPFNFTIYADENHTNPLTESITVTILGSNPV